jgi:hypothetical protein
MIAPPKPPSHDELEALIKEARERQARRRLLVAAGLAIAAALGLGAYAFTIGGGVSNVAQPRGSVSRAGAPLCRSPQLVASVGFQASTQMLVGGAEVKNVSGSVCLLPRGWPSMRLLLHGKPLVVRQKPNPPAHGVAPQTPSARVLAPGARAGIEMQWGNVCSVPHMPVSHGGIPLVADKVTFVIRFGSSLAVAATETGTPRCLSASGPATLVVGTPQLS